MEIGHKIEVLDYGYVKLIDYMGSDESVIEAARMSVNKGFEGWDKDGKLLEYLYENRHMTPFECGGELHVEVQAPILVFRQWHRHRTFSYNEMSSRYTKMPDVHYLPESSRLTKQSKTNKQSSSEELLDDDLRDSFLFTMREQQEEIYEDYQEFVHKGMSREIARLNCPVSRYSKMRAKTDLRNWLHFLGLRLHPHAQYETRMFAAAAAEIVKALWPRTYALFEKHSLHSVAFSRDDADILRMLLGMLPAETQGLDRMMAKLGAAK